MIFVFSYMQTEGDHTFHSWECKTDVSFNNHDEITGFSTPELMSFQGTWIQSPESKVLQIVQQEALEELMKGNYDVAIMSDWFDWGRYQYMELLYQEQMRWREDD